MQDIKFIIMNGIKKFLDYLILFLLSKLENTVNPIPIEKKLNIPLTIPPVNNLLGLSFNKIEIIL